MQPQGKKAVKTASGAPRAAAMAGVDFTATLH